MAAPLTAYPIMSYDKGLISYQKPVFLPEKGWQTLENAFVWRQSVQKRPGLKFLGRLARGFTNLSLGNSGASPWTVMLLTSGVITGFDPTLEPNAEIAPESVTIVIGAITYTDQGNGLLTSVTPGNSGTINYTSGEVVLTTTAIVGTAATASFSYYPSLPVMGIPSRDTLPTNDQSTQTIWFDQIYAYVWTGTEFAEFSPADAVTWNSSNSDFFWAANYRGVNPQDKYFFVSNFIADAANPMRYYDGTQWNTFQPIVFNTPATNYIFSAKIIVPYYGRLVLLGTYEGTSVGSSVLYSNRCRASAYAQDPTSATAFLTDVFGQGAVIDAPTNESVVTAIFIKNTLIVSFETETWQLRYVGEYGLPFIWERVSSDLGSESTFSAVLFDNFMLSVGNRAITAANAAGVSRIDQEIPDEVFTFKNSNNGAARVHGIRDYEKELVYWCFANSNTQAAPGVDQIFPNYVLLYNYVNKTWAMFRDSVTAFGDFQLTTDITWDSTSVTWDSPSITWDNIGTQSLFPQITSGNQQGFVHLYQEAESPTGAYPLVEEPSLSVTGVTFVNDTIELTVINHNLQTGEIIYLINMQFISPGVPPQSVVSTSLNDTIYQVQVVDKDTLVLFLYNASQDDYYSNFTFTPIPSSNPVYVGGGQIILIPKLNLITRDINIYQTKGIKTKLSRVEFLMEATHESAMSVFINLNSSTSLIGNSITGNVSLSTALKAPYQPTTTPPQPISDYAWFKLYATTSAQYFNLQLTYNDALMNDLTTHQEAWVLYAINAFCRPGGRL